MGRLSKGKKVLLTVIAGMIALLHIIPFYILITTSLKQRGDFSSRWVFPDYLTFENFTIAWERANLLKTLINTGIVSLGSAVLLIVFGSMAAYPLARIQTRLNRFVFYIFISIMVVPPLTALVPLYQLVVRMGMLNTLEIAILNNTAAFLPLAIFLYVGFIRSSVPKELEEAAKIDGTSTLGTFFRIVFPLLKPVTASVLIICCIYIWNDYQFAIFFLQDKSVHTITVTMSSFFGENQSNLNLVASAALISSLPMIILFLLLQRYFIQELASGSVKG